MKNGKKSRQRMKRRKNRKMMAGFICSLLILAVLSVAAAASVIKGRGSAYMETFRKQPVEYGQGEKQDLSKEEQDLSPEKRDLSSDERWFSQKEQNLSGEDHSSPESSESQDEILFEEEETALKKEQDQEKEQTTPLEEDYDIALQIEEYLADMSMEEKVAQLFIVTPESLVGVKNVTAAGESTREVFGKYPVGGFIYMKNNLLSSVQVKEMLSNIQKYSMERIHIPAFTCVDEEGGTVARISGTGRFDVPDIENMSAVGETKDVRKAYETGDKIGAYLSELGFNVDFAPVADVLSNPANKVVKLRSFGNDPDLVAEMTSEVGKGLKEHHVFAVLKHYPGHGGTKEDSHQGYAYTEKSLEELQECELVPFQKGIDDNISFIMAGHISVPNVTGDDTPTSLSHVMITGILRGRMGYQGIVVTDAMNMGAVSQHYSPAEASVNAVLAGVDIILMPEDFYAAYDGVLEAVNQEQISEERINESVRRILSVKLRINSIAGD